MHRIRLSLLPMFVVSTMLTGCFSDSESLVAGNSTSSLRTGVLQGCVYDATTGDPLSGNSLQVYLVQGVEDRSPDKLIRDQQSVLAGEYAFGAIPMTTASTLTSTFKLVVERDGYRRFESEFSFAVGNDTLKNAYNKIGNVFLYKMTDTAQDVRVVTTCGNLPCAGATAFLKPISYFDSTLSTTTVGTPTSSGSEGAGRNTRLFPTVSTYNILTAKTDSAGVAVFPGSGLSLGARYQAYVKPFTDANGIRYLETTDKQVFIAGVSKTNHDIALSRAVDTMPAVSFDLNSWRQSESLQVNGDSTVKITFTLNRPIVLVRPNDFSAFIRSDSDSLGVDTTLRDSVILTPKEPDTTIAGDSLFHSSSYAKMTSSSGYRIDSTTSPGKYAVWQRDKKYVRPNEVLFKDLLSDTAFYKVTPYSKDTVVVRWISRDSSANTHSAIKGIKVASANATLSNSGTTVTLAVKLGRNLASSSEKITMGIESPFQGISYYVPGYEDAPNAPYGLFDITLLNYMLRSISISAE